MNSASNFRSITCGQNPQKYSESLIQKRNWEEMLTELEHLANFTKIWLKSKAVIFLEW